MENPPARHSTHRPQVLLALLFSCTGAVALTACASTESTDNSLSWDLSDLVADFAEKSGDDRGAAFLRDYASSRSLDSALNSRNGR